MHPTAGKMDPWATGLQRRLLSQGCPFSQLSWEPGWFSPPDELTDGHSVPGGRLGTEAMGRIRQACPQGAPRLAHAVANHSTLPSRPTRDKSLF